ncbi:unnamed protein product [Medioppia subpectinata]|uniref:Uncharacterized protein n=1 Tax=Medioppia subpectinata TaxID=1979941 RepID=A0A7R9QDU6_9ACAR|nr:unnamed protein product [Medioppia subpectinata]CAG2119041.1 unnamed protein product [Medioppia subpectinata]
MTKAIIHDSGKVEWNPPAIYKSSCNIDINYFPFDQQECFMKFGSWTYDGNQVDLKHLYDPIGEPDKESVVDYGIDLSEFYINVEWDIMTVPAMKRIKYYSCCPEPYIDVTFNVTLRRKTLFYTVNLIIPCVGISCLSVLVFYLPSDSGEKFWCFICHQILAKSNRNDTCIKYPLPVSIDAQNGAVGSEDFHKNPPEVAFDETSAIQTRKHRFGH